MSAATFPQQAAVFVVVAYNSRYGFAFNDAENLILKCGKVAFHRQRQLNSIQYYSLSKEVVKELT